MPVGLGVPRIEILTASGRILTGDPASVANPPMLNLAQAKAKAGRIFDVSHPAYLPVRRAAVITLRIVGTAGPLTIIVVGSLDQADAQTNHALALSGLLAAVSLAVVAAVAWFTTGRTLRRVERIRALVSSIATSDDLSQRVPDSGYDELGRLAHTLNQMLAVLADNVDRHRRFVADAAHELRTPLSGVTAAFDVAVRHPETIDSGWIHELAASHRGLSHLIDDLLELAALDGGAPRHHQTLDLANIVTDAIRQPLPRGLRISAEQIQSAHVNGNPTQLARIVTNLIDNAVRHARSTVEVTLRSHHEHAVLSIADDGPGIPAADHKRVWERFVRLDTSRSRSSGGTGLGLALVKQLVQAHGGSATVTRAEMLGGAQFTVHIPLSHGRQPDDEPQTTRPNGHSQPPLGLSPAPVRPTPSPQCAFLNRPRMWLLRLLRQSPRRNLGSG
jgi:signal transduction histidine kinase